MNKIKSIKLDVDTYGVNKGKLTGSIEITNQYGEIKIMVDPEKAGEIIRILAPALVATAQDVGAMMVASVEAQAKMLPDLVGEKA